ncbi:MAG: lysophospholipid acyltransferase family protein [Pseudomonadota bacterium]
MRILARSCVFHIWMYGLMMLCGIAFLPAALWSRAGAYWGIDVYLRLVFWGLNGLCGLRVEIRGKVPTENVIVASKHQSFLDVLILVYALPEPKIVMKDLIRWVPVLGFYGMRMGNSPIRRGKGRASVDQLMSEVAKRSDLDGQLVIYPQGSRIVPGVEAPYKAGAHLIYDTYRLPCVPAAVNTGHFWPRISPYRYPGLAVIEFLEPLPAGLSRNDFTNALRTRIEPASDALSAEAREVYGR